MPFKGCAFVISTPTTDVNQNRSCNKQHNLWQMHKLFDVQRLDKIENIFLCIEIDNFLNFEWYKYIDKTAKWIDNKLRKIYLYYFNHIIWSCLQEYSVQITFRQQWNDNRLAFNDLKGRIKYLTMTDSKKVWMPDTFFRNEKNGQFHNIIQPNLYIRVFPNGDVLYSIR